MAQNHYEGMFLVDSSKFANDPDGVMNHIRELLTKTGATIREDRVWMDGKLAYPVEGRRRGVHFLVLFQGDGNANTEITRQIKLSELVLRHLVIRHPEVMWDRLVAAISGESVAEEKPPVAGKVAEGKATEAAEGETAEGETTEVEAATTTGAGESAST